MARRRRTKQHNNPAIAAGYAAAAAMVVLGGGDIALALPQGMVVRGGQLTLQQADAQEA